MKELSEILKSLHDSGDVGNALEGLSDMAAEQGFIDNRRVFVDRNKAWKIAEAANQINFRCGGDTEEGGTLYSENLY